MAKKVITKAQASKAATVVTNYTKQEAKKHGKSIAKTTKKLTTKAFSGLKRLAISSSL